MTHYGLYDEDEKQIVQLHHIILIFISHYLTQGNIDIDLHNIFISKKSWHII